MTQPAKRKDILEDHHQAMKGILLKALLIIAYITLLIYEI